MGHKSGRDLIFHILNFAVVACVAGEGIKLIIDGINGNGVFSTYMFGAYWIFFAFVIFALEIKPPDVILIGFGMFRWWAGRGLCYIFLGLLGVGSISSSALWGVFSLVPIIVGAGYIALQFLKAFEQPDPIAGDGYGKL
eukprot:TRINITY_DN13215_c0_g1_i1.p1 TRINITY_DN13215_c0_g1~~TRINITY_DN13215_c0_g1_i1.p1  ORF type:complete len:139 (-),score=16.66 TRINITY_DN13215_c0_g1_i1:72-488(-)